MKLTNEDIAVTIEEIQKFFVEKLRHSVSSRDFSQR